MLQQNFQKKKSHTDGRPPWPSSTDYCNILSIDSLVAIEINKETLRAELYDLLI